MHALKISPRKLRQQKTFRRYQMHFVDNQNKNESSKQNNKPARASCCQAPKTRPWNSGKSTAGHLAAIFSGGRRLRGSVARGYASAPAGVVHPETELNWIAEASPYAGGQPGRLPGGTPCRCCRTGNVTQHLSVAEAPVRREEAAMHRRMRTGRSCLGNELGNGRVLGEDASWSVYLALRRAILLRRLRCCQVYAAQFTSSVFIK